MKCDTILIFQIEVWTNSNMAVLYFWKMHARKIGIIRLNGILCVFITYTYGHNQATWFHRDGAGMERSNLSKPDSSSNKDLRVCMQNHIHLCKAVDSKKPEWSDRPKHHFLAFWVMYKQVLKRKNYRLEGDRHIEQARCN
jgi:hypothetical protein